MWLSDEAGPPSTGTWLDEFLPIYWWLARDTKVHRGFSQAEVDAMDLSLVAALLGVGGGGSRFERESMAMIEARVRAAEQGLPEPTWEDVRP